MVYRRKLIKYLLLNRNFANEVSAPLFAIAFVMCEKKKP